MNEWVSLICKQVTQTVTITLSGLELWPLLPSLYCLGRLPPLAPRVETLSLALTLSLSLSLSLSISFNFYIKSVFLAINVIVF